VLLYRVKFCNSSHIAGEDEFPAKDDLTALVLAKVLAAACSDLCDSFQLWQGDRRVLGEILPAAAGKEELREHVQHLVIEREEAIRDSRQAISASRTLLARLENLCREVHGGELTKDMHAALLCNRMSERWRSLADAIPEDVAGYYLRQIFQERAKLLSLLEARSAIGSIDEK